MNRFVFFAAVLFTAIVSCTVQETSHCDFRDTIVGGKELVFTADYGDNQLETKTVLIQDGLLPDQQPRMVTRWSPSEEICIFYGASGGSKFVSTNTEPVVKASFTGTLSAFTGVNDSGEYDYFWAVYPYDAAVSCDGESVIADLADRQEALAGSFANKTNLTIAKSPGLALGFYNVCSFFRFRVEKEGVIAVTFQGNNDENVAGRIRVSIGDDGKPTAPVVLDGKKEIKLTRPNNEPFVVGESYYFVILPQTFENGFTFRFDTATEYGYKVVSISAPFERNSINYGINAFDHNVDYIAKVIPDAVDLGLSVRWASFNLGATQPEEVGHYYAWGETREKTKFTRENYKWYSERQLYDYSQRVNLYYTKYGTIKQNGEWDRDIKLNVADDAAHHLLGGEWRIPTGAELKELYNGCTWESETVNGVDGFRVTSKTNGNSLFLPFSGYYLGESIYFSDEIYYWGSSLFMSMGEAEGDPWIIHGSSTSTVWCSDNYGRYIGCPIRPVLGDPAGGHEITFNQTSIVTSEGERFQLPFTVPDEGESPSFVIEDSFIARNNQFGDNTITLDAFSSGSTSIVAYHPYRGTTSVCDITVNQSVPEAVDLGLSVKWASHDLGSNDDHLFSRPYAWGETHVRKFNTDGYLGFDVVAPTWSSYDWSTGPGGYSSEPTAITKYNTLTTYGTPDNITTLASADDIVTVELGEKWRMPLRSEIEELLDQCTWTWTTRNVGDETISGFNVTSKINGQSIFIKASTSIQYTPYSSYLLSAAFWSSSLHGGKYAYVLRGAENKPASLAAVDRIGSYSIRPVYGDMVIIPVSSLAINHEALTMDVGDSNTLTVTVSPSNATDDNVLWVSSNPSVVSVDSEGKVSALAGGFAVITATSIDGQKSVSCSVTVLGNIEFADAAVKAICVDRWDTNHDGELSYKEARSVTTIPYGVFSGNTTITSFNEFQYFTGITSFGYDSEYDEGMDYYGAFYNCTALTSITLPSTLTVISYACFRGCSALAEIVIPASVTTIQQIAFLGCTNLDVYLESATPCTLQKDTYDTYPDPYVFGFLTSGRVRNICVPTEESVTAYKSATYWSSYSSLIKRGNAI